MIPYSTSSLSAEDKSAVMRVLDRNYLTRGVEMQAFEARLAEISGKKCAVSFANATVALWACVRLFQTYEVWSTPLTYSAILNAIMLDGNSSQLTFVDVDRETLCAPMPIAHNGLDDALYCPMDYAGYPSLEKPIPHRGGCFTLLDACHSLGAKLSDGSPNVKHADAAVYSFHPVKHITTGEGGCVVTDNESFAHDLRALRNNGIVDGLQVTTGLNLHLDEMSCALGLSQLDRLDHFIVQRRMIAFIYNSHWAQDPRLELQAFHPGHVYHLYVIRLSPAVRCDVATFRHELGKLGVGSQVHYRPLHLQPVLRHLDYKGCYPVAEAAWERMLSIPIYPGIKNEEIKLVMDAVDTLLDKYGP